MHKKSYFLLILAQISTQFTGIVKSKGDTIFTELNNLAKLSIGVVVFGGIVFLSNIFGYDIGPVADYSSKKVISFSPALYNFEPVAPGKHLETTKFEILNIAGQSIQVGSVYIQDQNFKVVANSCPKPPILLMSGERCDVTVQFTPSGIGKFHSNLEVYYILDTNSGTTATYSPKLVGTSNTTLSNQETSGTNPNIAGFY